MNAGRLGRILAAGLAVLLLVLVTALSVLDGPRAEVPGSVVGVEPQGRRAAYLLLGELGWPVEAWNQRPGVLPAGRHVLWMADVPDYELEELEQTEETEAEQPDGREPDALDLARAQGLRSPRHYRGFVEQGGTLVIPFDEQTRSWLTQDLGLDELQGIEAGPPARTPLEVAGEAVEILRLGDTLTARIDERVPRDALIVDAEGNAVVLEVPVGRGRVVLLADDRFLDNRLLPEAGHALLLVRLAEMLDRGGRHLFDEYALGRWSEPSPASLALQPDKRLFTLHVVLVALLATWCLAWVREFPRDPEAFEQVSPLSRARAQADLLLRARRVDVLADLLRRGVLRRLLPRRGRRAARGADPSPASAPELEALAAGCGRAGDAERWKEALLTRPVRRLSDLARLDQDLRRIEAAVGRSETALSPSDPRPTPRP